MGVIKFQTDLKNKKTFNVIIKKFITADERHKYWSKIK